MLVSGRDMRQRPDIGVGPDSRKGCIREGPAQWLPRYPRRADLTLLDPLTKSAAPMKSCDYAAPDRRLSQQGLRVLRAFLDAFNEDVRAELAGADIMRVARLSSGTLYPILLRFEKAV